MRNTYPPDVSGGPRGMDAHAFPFPLSDGTIATLWLPREGLRRADAERMGEYLKSLVTEDEQ